jgi:hypothetical protein
LSGDSFSQETKWFSLPLAHIQSHFADNRHRRHDIDAIDLGQVRTGHAKQLFPQVKLWIAFLLLAPSLSRLFRQSGPLGPILSSREVKTRIPPGLNERKKNGAP